MKSQDTASFDAVIGNYYGRGPAPQSMAQRTQALLARYYGKPLATANATPPARKTPTVAVSMSADNGELMRQRPDVAREAEYVVAASLSRMLDEYVMDARPPAYSPGDPTVQLRCAAPEAPCEGDARTEYTVDLAPPAAPQPGPLVAAPGLAPSTQPPAREQVSEAKSADDAFIEDMKAILSGQMVYDPRSKATVRPNQLDALPDDGRSLPGQGSGAPGSPAAPAVPSGGDAIFERIARSMQYANAYDLGTIELENRFADFDRVEELKRKAAADKKPRQAAPPKAEGATSSVGSAEFLQDMDAIHSMQASVAQACPSGSPQAVSRQFYDTGEHVLFGGSFYPEQLRVGANPGLAFSYGQIIAMADLFESVDQMMAIDVGQLGRIKALIERGTAYYAGNKADPKKDVSDDEWDSVTGGRYLALAELNFEHFSPNFLFRDAIFAGAANRHGNNKSAWEAHHLRAIHEAQAIGGAPAGNSSPMLPLEGPLITNAFGDHFLTDAFAAGHLINKDAVTEYWKTLFFDGSSLNAAAKGFFGRLADKAFTLGQVKARFSKLETVDRHYGLHRDIDSASRFASVLEGIAEQEPDRIANMVMKAIHDRLNADGVEVFNDAGDGSWVLTGDGKLNAKNRQIIQRAVEQSIANITDPAILVSNLDEGAFLAKVWKHVPQLTPASQQKVQAIVREYVKPDSTVLVDAAASIIEGKLDILIRELIKAGALRVA
ncbi:hypothetical protein AWB81_07017 [Caballeronia arationis]|uniref:hypothetical protein n=1 Tax=Caballeronia arationis TaxID=1777142 RepID=UPI00074CB089|nr:hypothetical protein [Caballeronia arationis]SAL05097.1 hypothetical protein AWB81_07017 [Caballeronia arationis]